jgi:hypothetical protein
LSLGNPPRPPEDALRYAFAFVALILALIVGIIGVLIYFANAPKSANPAPAPAASSSVAN